MSIAGLALLLVATAGPLLFGVWNFFSTRGAPAPSLPKAPWDWRLTVGSTLIYAIAFNLIFFIQELFLVAPKALTPGLHPVLFHNNHDWTGDNPLAELWQGTGALATFVTALICAGWLARRPPRPVTARLFLFWLAFSGVFMSLPQVAVGAFIPRNDVGRAMTYLGFTPEMKTVAALVALATVVALAVWLTPRLLGLATQPSWVESPGRKTGFVFRIGALPAIIGTLLVIPFRVPGHVIEVAVLPAVVALIGMGWIQAGAGRVNPAPPAPDAAPPRIIPPLAALVALLLIFQLVLRPGIAFG